jgi:transposase InsO family protein
LARTTTTPLKTMARDLGISVFTLRDWIKRTDAGGDSSTLEESGRLELRRLRLLQVEPAASRQTYGGVRLQRALRTRGLAVGDKRIHWVDANRPDPRPAAVLPGQAVLATHGVQPSMSRVGDCWDVNAAFESFFSGLIGSPV